MLHLLNIESEHHYPRARKEMHELRFREFVQKQKYNTSVHRDMEFDEFDTPAASYLVYLSQEGRVIACSRLSPTSFPFMIEKLWKDKVCTALPRSGEVWESSRICIDESVIDHELRKRIVSSIIVGHFEFAAENNIKRYIGIMPSKLWKKTLIDRGWQVIELSNRFLLDGHETYVAEFVVCKDALKKVRKKTGIEEKVLRLPDGNNGLNALPA